MFRVYVFDKWKLLTQIGLLLNIVRIPFIYNYRINPNN